jgi:CRP-like cAMP-binding protein
MHAHTPNSNCAVYFDKRGAGESFGEASFFTDTPSHEAVMTCSVVRLLLVSRATFEGLLDQVGPASRQLLGSF